MTPTASLSSSINVFTVSPAVSSPLHSSEQEDLAPSPSCREPFRLASVVAHLLKPLPACAGAVDHCCSPSTHLAQPHHHLPFLNNPQCKKRRQHQPKTAPTTVIHKARIGVIAAVLLRCFRLRATSYPIRALGGEEGVYGQLVASSQHRTCFSAPKSHAVFLTSNMILPLTPLLSSSSCPCFASLNGSVFAMVRCTFSSAIHPNSSFALHSSAARSAM